MNRIVFWSNGPLMAALLAFTAISVTLNAADSGVDGTISVSPSRPGPLRKGEPAEAPVSQTAFVVMQGGKKVAAFTTDAEGHFHLTLPPGHYVVTREQNMGAIGHWQFEVDVNAGKMAAVHWMADSGMR